MDELINTILFKLELIESQLSQQKEVANALAISNEDFIKKLGVSRRTAQTWRDEGKIIFTQVGKKIYYQQTDIQKFLESHKIQNSIKA